VALLAGCVVGPDYKRPVATTIPGAYAGATNGWKVAQPQAQFSKGNWWEVFGDAELNELEVQSSAANQQLKAAVDRFAEARAAMDATRSGLFPFLSLSGSYTRQRTSANAPAGTTSRAAGRSSTYNDFTVPLDLAYEVDLWGRVRRSIESARAQAQATADDLEAIKLAIQAEVAVDYFTLRALDSQLAVLRANVEVFSKSLELTMNRRVGGVATDLDVAQAQTILDTTQAQLPAVTLQRARFEHALAALVGQPASAFHVPERALATEPPFIPSGVPSELLERRPDISAAERRMAAANADIGVAKAAFFPSIKLNGLAGLESISAGTLFNASSGFWAVGPTLNLPIFEGGRLRANLRLAKATYEEVIANYRQSVLSAFSDVEDNLSAQDLLASQYDAQSNALIAARKQLEIADNRYRNGLVTYLEVATAQNTVLNVEFATAQLRGQRLIAAVTLVKALGGGWENTNLQTQETHHIGMKKENNVEQMRKAQGIAPITSLQPPYSIIRREIEEEVLPFCRWEGIGVIVYSPMASGLLTGAMTRERAASLPANDWRSRNAEFQEPKLSQNLALVERLQAVGARHGRSPGQVAIAWTLRHPAVTGAIVGARNARQVEEIMAGVDFSLTPQEIVDIEGKHKEAELAQAAI
jgi:multidrug efflux system outer membrane protein